MPQRAIELFCFAVLGAGCLFGGSNEPGRALLAIPELVSLPLFCLALLAAPRPGRAPIALAATILGLPLLQLLPLPPWLWTALPGRAAVAQAYALADIPLPWLPLSLTPEATREVWLRILPAVALFLAVTMLSLAARRRLMQAAVLVGVLDVVLGLLQLAGGAESALRLYAGASRTDAVGLFANRNHQATFLALLLPLCGALAVGRTPTAAARVWLGGAGTMLLLGIVASGSRAGLVLGVGAALATLRILLAAWRGGRFRIPRWGAAGLVAAALLLGFGVLTLRAGAGLVVDDLRWQIARTTWRAIVEYFPIGAGFGSFERVYAQVERSDDLVAAFVNNAHDDWLEVVLEGGLPALLLLLAGAGYLVRESFLVAADRGRTPFARAVGTATLAALWLAALHSTVDYPLRTMSVNVVLALACGLRLAARHDPAEADGPARRRGAAAASPQTPRRRAPPRVAVRSA